MMTPEQVTEIKTRCREIEEKFPGSSPEIRDMQAYWREYRPQMWKRLTQQGLTFAYPKVLEQRVYDRALELRKQGNPESQMQARMEILGDLMVPEED